MSFQHRRSIVSLCAAVVLVVGLTGCESRYGATLNQPDDPIVLTGADTPALVGAAPQHVVGFSWDGSAWHQIPVQVDERDLVNPGEILHLSPVGYPKLKGTSTPYEILVYTPPAASTPDYTVYPTYTPADSDPTVDADDEISFMAYDSGKVAPQGSTPPGVDAASRQVVTATDPLAPDNVGTVYLFTSSTLTGGSAGTTGVGYTFSLDSGDYKATYKMGTSALAPNRSSGYNPETSTVATPSYEMGFADRWINDSLKITRGGASGIELLDRTNYFATGVNCQRTEDTFSGKQSTPGAFIANISGPVRAIRSYMGANSFTYTNVTHVFYESREDVTVNLIGHAGMPGFGIGTDLATGLAGMTYSDANNTELVIDGVPDGFSSISATTGSGPLPPTWQVVKGSAGTVVSARTLETSIDGLEVRSTYADASPQSPTPCTGDTSTWGYHGSEINSPTNFVPDLDPTRVTNPATFISTGFRYFQKPDFDVAGAYAIELRATHPIITSVSN